MERKGCWAYTSCCHITLHDECMESTLRHDQLTRDRTCINCGNTDPPTLTLPHGTTGTTTPEPPLPHHDDHSDDCNQVHREPHYEVQPITAMPATEKERVLSLFRNLNITTESRTGPDPYLELTAQSSLQDNKGWVTTATLQDQLLGACITTNMTGGRKRARQPLTTRCEHAQITLIGVDEPHRKTGIGSALWRTTETYLSKLPHLMTVEVRGPACLNMTASRAFWTSHDFRISATGGEINASRMLHTHPGQMPTGQKRDKGGSSSAHHPMPNNKGHHTTTTNEHPPPQDTRHTHQHIHADHNSDHKVAAHTHQPRDTPRCSKCSAPCTGKATGRQGRGAPKSAWGFSTVDNDPIHAHCITGPPTHSIGHRTQSITSRPHQHLEQPALLMREP